MGYPLTLVAGPAGSGKTTVLAQWALCQTQPLAWLSLDAGDRDPARALARLAASLQPLRVGPEATSPPDLEQLLVRLLNELARNPLHVVLVLDNYHAIECSPLDVAVGRLLDYLPPQVHLVFAGRGRPAWPLGHLRVRGQLLEIGAADLRLSPMETAALLQAMLGRAAPEQAQVLHARCEGWAQGLRLAVETMRGSADWAEAARTFSGRHPALASYFAAEVLGHEPAEVCTFLLQTSVLECLSAPLCNAVTGRHDGQAMLEQLERRDLFTIPLDSERRRYRYHNLFAGYLQDALERARPALAADLRRRATAWAGRR